MTATLSTDTGLSPGTGDRSARRAALRAAGMVGRRNGPAVPAWVRLMRVFHKVQQVSVEGLRERGLTTGQFDVLAQVGSAEGSTQQEVANALLVTKSNVCQLLDRMEEAGLVERRQHGRSKQLFLTCRGRRLYDEIVPAHERQIAALFSSLSSEQQTQLLRLLRTVDRALD